MTFTSLIAEQRFVLRTLADMDRLKIEPDIIDAVLEGVAQLAAGEWAPLRRVGDTIGAKWSEAGVRLPEGFAAAYRAYVEGGWGGIAAPQGFGGQNLPFALQMAVLETLGAANFAFALLPILTTGSIEALIHHGSEEQKRLYLPRLTSGEWAGTMNLTEPQAGSDVGALRTRATPRQDGRWNITGQKIFISFGDHDLTENIIHLVLARTPDAPEGTRGISLFLVPKYRLDESGAPSAFNDVRAVSIEHKMGLHASPTCMLSFGDNCECVGELIGAIGGGMPAMFTVMNNARLNIGLQGVQIAEAATDKASAFAAERIQSARAGSANRAPVPIAEHPDVRRMLLRMKAQTQAARALVYYAASMVDRSAGGDQDAQMRLELLTPLAKAHATDIGCEVASLCMQVHGGVGYVEETGVAQFLRDVRIARIYEGTNGIQAADLVGRKLGLDNGGVLLSLINDMRRDAEGAPLCDLIAVCDEIGRGMAGLGHDDRLAASYPYLTMLSTAVCGWLMEREARAAPDDAFGRTKKIVCRFYLEQVLPEAMGLRAAATASADLLYALDADALRA